MVEQLVSNQLAGVRFLSPAPMSQKGEFESVLAQYECSISYYPFEHEPEPTFPFDIPPVAYTVPKNHSADPGAVAEEVKALVGEKRACLFIPGTAFDSHGTRHGRGGGWYDRFLAAVPTDWLRVGVCTKAEFSSEPLTRESWDQPVDWVVVQTAGEWEYYQTNICT